MAEEKGGQTWTNRQRNLSAIGLLAWFMGYFVIAGETGLSRDPEWSFWDIAHFLGGLLLTLFGFVICFENSGTTRLISRYPIKTGIVLIGFGVVFSAGMIWSFGFPKSLIESNGVEFGGIVLLCGFYLIIRGRRIRAKQTEADKPPVTDSETTEPEDN